MNIFWNRLTSLWGGLNSGQKTAVAGAAVLSVLAIVLMVSWATRPNMQTAFTNLSPEDASAMSEKLKEEGIAYQLTNGGTTIMVPSEKVAQARVGLASSGLPKGGTEGFELFDKQNFGATDFSQRVNYRRALEGELSRTISELDEVESARVHIALGKESLFIDKEKPATSAVIMKLRPGSELTSRQVKGIIRLVAGSVEGLEPKNVTLTDMSGNMLTAENGGAPGDESGGANSQQNAKQRYERDMEQRLDSMLVTALGANKVITKVAAEMDFDETEEKSTTYSPVVGGQGIVGQEATSTENFQGSKLPGGVAGTPANIPGAANVQGGTATSSYEKGTTERSYKVNRTDTVKKKAVGAVKRQTVAVLVDGRLSPVEVDRIRGIVEAGAGIDVGRGDIVRVESLPFNEGVAASERKEMLAEGKRTMYLSVVKYGLLAIGLLGFLLFLMSRMRRSRDVLSPGEPFFQSPEALPDLMPSQISAGGNLQIGEGQSRKPEIVQLPVDDMVEERPDDAARLVRGWLNSGD